jgi:CDP-2,3-bis-(O-geranylgeranyl)-sn-glycerol synthase
MKTLPDDKNQEMKWKNQAVWICVSFLLLFVGQLVFYLMIWNINDWTCTLLLQIILIMPAYFSNAGMLLFGRGGKPLDKGKYAKDGNRIFGPGKTIRGYVLGPLFGICASILIHFIFFLTWNGIESIILDFFGGSRIYILYNYEPSVAVELFRRYMLGTPSGSTWYSSMILLILRLTLISYGSASGDLLGSWIKRRVRKKRGQPLWGIDQLDFILPVLILALPFVIVDRSYLAVIVFVIIFTPFMALISNMISFISGLKDVPY